MSLEQIIFIFAAFVGGSVIAYWSFKLVFAVGQWFTSRASYKYVYETFDVLELKSLRDGRLAALSSRIATLERYNKILEEYRSDTKTRKGK